MKKYIFFLAIALNSLFSSPISAQNEVQKPTLDNVAASPQSFSPPKVATIENITLDDQGKITPPFNVEDTKAEEYFKTMIDPIYAVLVLLLGLISSWVPGLQKIDKKSIRVAAIGVVLGIGFITFGGAGFWKVALSYVFANFTYIVSVKPIVKDNPQPIG
jgi:hypothetical protein